MEILLISIIVILDQASKFLIRMNLKPDGSISLINGFFSFYYLKNRGIAFGKLENQKWLIIGITSAVILFMLYYLLRHKNISKWMKISFILIIAGALGNLIDRIALGYVVDFFSFIDSTKYPVFNIADIGVIFGTILLAIQLLLSKEN